MLTRAHPAPGVCAVYLHHPVGSAHDPTGRSGMAHLAEHVRFQGSANVAPDEHFAAIETVGGETNATTSFERTDYYTVAPRGALDLALWLEADRLAGVRATDTDVDAQRRVVLRERRQRHEDPAYGTALERVLGRLFGPDHPYGRHTVGLPDDLARIDAPALRRFVAQRYTPASTTVAVVGDIDPQDALTAVDHHLGAVDGAPAPPHPPLPTDPAPHDGDPSVVATTVPTPSVVLARAVPPADSPAHLPFEVLVGLLSGTHGLLARRLEQFDLAERARIELLDIGRGVDVAVTTLVHPAAVRTAEAVAAYDATLRDIARDGPHPRDMRRGTARVRAGRVAIHDDPARHAAALARGMGDTHGDIAAWVDAPHSITADHVSHAAQHLLTDRAGVRYATGPT